MTRFARAKGSKASNERVCEEATSWEEMKSQMLNKKLEMEEKEKREEAEEKRNANYQQFLKERKEQEGNHTEWAEFPNSLQVKKNKRKSSEPNESRKKKKIEKEIPSVEDDSGIDMHILSTKDSETSKKKVKSETPHQKDNYDSDAPEECTSKNEVVQPSVKKLSSKKKKLKIVLDKESELSEHSKVGKGKKKILKKEIDLDSLPENEKNKVLKKQERRRKQVEKKNLKKKLKKENLEDKSELKKEDSADDKISSPNTEKNVITFKSKQAKFEKPIKKMEKKVDSKIKIGKKDKKYLNEEFKRRKENQSDKIMINGKEVMLEYYDGFPIKKEDAQNLKKLRSQMISKGLPRSEITRTLKLERRKAEKALAREKKKVCFNCRKFGHNLSECPEISGKDSKELIESAGTGICFKCGSTEHTSFVCRVVQGQSFKFASCFICKEQGHISRQCPDNARGLYPKGGACRVCGDVTHLKKDCPKFQIQQEKENDQFKVQTFDGGNPDNLDQHESNNNRIVQVKSNKVIKF